MKILASDFDGTLCRTPESTITDAEAVRRFREAGHKFGIASGRGLSSLVALQKSKDIPCDFLLANTTTVCTSGEEIIFTEKITSIVLPALFECILQGGGVVFSITKEYNDYFIPTGHNIYKLSGIELTLSNAHEIEYCTQISTVMPSKEAAADLVKKINEQFNDTLSAFQNGICIDIIAKGWSKAEGVAKLARHLGVDKKDVYTIGDNYNDIPMLSAFNSFVVSSAPDDIKKYASVAVVPTVADAIDMILKLN